MATDTSTAATESTVAGDDGTEIEDGGPEAARAGRRRRRADPAADRRRLDLCPRRADQGAPHLGGGRRGADGLVRAGRPLERALAGAGRLGRSLGDGGDPGRRPRPRRKRPDDGARRARGDADSAPPTRSRRRRSAPRCAWCDAETGRRRLRRDPAARLGRCRQRLRIGRRHMEEGARPGRAGGREDQAADRRRRRLRERGTGPHRARASPRRARSSPG